MLRRRRPHLRRNRRQMEFLWPFLLIILIGIVLVLFIQLVFSWMDQRDTDLKHKVYLYLAQGSAEILPWGETEWAKAHNQLVLEGDRIQMEEASRGVLEFYNDTTVRLNADADVLLDTVEADEDSDNLHLTLKNGRLWSTIVQNMEGTLTFVVETDHLRITSHGTIFEVEMTDREAVRVLEDSVLVEILDRSEGKEAVVDQVQVGVGQQVELTAGDIQKLMARQPVPLLEAIDDESKATDWFVWNRQEDESPTDFSSEQDQEVDEIEDEVNSADSEETIESTPEETVSGEEINLKLTSPKENPYTLPAGQTSLSLEGSVQGEASSIQVTHYDESGNALPYTLKSYTAGASEWRYNAAKDYGNLREGRNRFTIIAKDAEGNASDPLEVIVEVAEGQFGETVMEAESPESAKSSDSETTSTASTAALTLPQITSLNGDSLPSDSKYTTSSETVTVVGAVSSGSAAVYVNGFKLTKYVAGQTSWSYFMNEAYGNYQEGSNTYQVYSEDAQGNKSEVLNFEVVWEKATAEASE